MSNHDAQDSSGQYLEFEPPLPEELAIVLEGFRH